VVAALNTANTFSGVIVNAENIGKSSADLSAMWNKEHPDNLIEG
jgi:hypothetical protein